MGGWSLDRNSHRRDRMLDTKATERTHLYFDHSPKPHSRPSPVPTPGPTSGDSRSHVGHSAAGDEESRNSRVLSKTCTTQSVVWTSSTTTSGRRTPPLPLSRPEPLLSDLRTLTPDHRTLPNRLVPVLEYGPQTRGL